MLLNPPADTVYEAGDQLVVIAEDDSAIKLAATGAADASAIPALAAVPVVPERTLVLGYNSGLAAILRELHEYVPAGSSVTVVADIAEPALPSFPDFTVRFQRGDTTSRAVLDRLDVQLADHIIVLADKESPVQRADAKTLITLLHLRDISERADIDLNVVSEMLDDRNRELAEVTNADDFIVSDKLVSLMLTQVSENKQLTDVFENLFSAEGAEVYLRPAEFYVDARSRGRLLHGARGGPPPRRDRDRLPGRRARAQRRARLRRRRQPDQDRPLHVRRRRPRHRPGGGLNPALRGRVSILSMAMFPKRGVDTSSRRATAASRRSTTSTSGSSRRTAA